MNNSDVENFDKLSEAAFTSHDPDERFRALEHLHQFRTLAAWDNTLLVLQHSCNQFSLQFAASNLTDLFTQYHNRCVCVYEHFSLSVFRQIDKSF
jgi:hypothetical protein